MTVWLTRELLLAVHDEQIAEHGGAAGIRDIGLLESAVARPLNHARYGEVDVAELGAVYALAIVRQTRAGEKGVPDFVSDQLAWGAGPRAVQVLVVGAKARAVMQGRPHVSADDIRALAPPVLRHRVVVGFAAASEGVTPDDVIARIVESTPAREDELSRDPRFQTIFAS